MIYETELNKEHPHTHRAAAQLRLHPISLHAGGRPQPSLRDPSQAPPTLLQAASSGRGHMVQLLTSWFRQQDAWVPFPTLALTCGVTLGKVLLLCASVYPPAQMRGREGGLRGLVLAAPEADMLISLEESSCLTLSGLT